MKVLYINPTEKLCGIYQFGYRVYKHLANSKKLELHYAEPTSFDHFVQIFETIKPAAVLYSSNGTTVPWAYDPRVVELPAVHVGVSHEPEQCMLEPGWNQFGLDYFNGPAFPYWIGHDPTLQIPEGSRCFKAGRPISRFEYTDPPEVFTVGCQCFGFPHRGHRSVVDAVNREFDEAVIRFNMPNSRWGDPDGSQARATAEACQRLVTKPGIRFEATFDFFETEEEIIAWVAKNSMNAYFYDVWPRPHGMRGVASSPDLSISARRPCLVNESAMFRHLHSSFGIFPNQGTIQQLYQHSVQTKAAEQLYEAWTPEQMIADYENMFERIID